jgi:Ni/Fe-hydrogenase subunit HybB-like protein
MKVNAAPARQNLWTPWFTAGVVVILVGAIISLYRFIYGIGAVTNLSDGVPWGLWITFDVVTGIALAAGGFSMAALVYVFNRGHYSPLLRPALLTAMLGYGIAALAIVLDVGRWWQIYNPALPANWQGNSPLFEVSLCVMTYFTVLIIEFIPVAAERYKDSSNAFLRSLSHGLGGFVNKILFFLILLGIVISTLHQSSLGAVMMIAVHRLHPLWHSYWLPFLFLVSAIATGFSVIVIESTISARAFHRPVEHKELAGIARIVPWILALYLVLRFVDLAMAGKLGLIVSEPKWGILFIAEILLFAVVPMIMLFQEKVRNSMPSLFRAAVMIIAGLILNRFNTYLVAYSPRPGENYFPTLSEILVSAMMVALLFVGYKVLANNFPVLPASKRAGR